VTTIAGIRNSLHGADDIREPSLRKHRPSVSGDAGLCANTVSLARHGTYPCGTALRCPGRTSHEHPGCCAFSCAGIGWRSEVSSERELIDTSKDKRFVAPKASGEFKESDDVGRSSNGDRQQKAKRKVKSGQGDRGDR
jgi:hypothetical protein